MNRIKFQHVRFIVQSFENKVEYSTQNFESLSIFENSNANDVVFYL
jgi:hypothetical protein